MVDWYQQGVRPLLFHGVKLDPEWLHQQTLHLLAKVADTQSPTAANWVLMQRWLRDRCQFTNARLSQSLWNLTFANPMGLAAGFDKDGIAAQAWSLMGFGFAELGTVTRYPQPGNAQPRLFRLPKDQAVINRMGFNNQGAAQLAERLQQLWQRQPAVIPIGINLGKSKITPLDQAVEDYIHSFRLLKALGDYFVVNVSSPNTPGLRSQARCIGR
ncbi:MAG: dihydroorotate dehydrogenase (quinone) [Leptolyngbyaceae cyanobacterium]